MYIYDIWFLLRMRNVLGKMCREIQNTHFFQYFFPENLAFYEIMLKKLFCVWLTVNCTIKKYGRAGQATDYNMDS